MTIRHRPCWLPITHRLVLGDDGDPAIVRWCEMCDCAPDADDCEPAGPIEVAEIPPTLVAQLIQIAKTLSRCD